jgi:hypothetical protein
MFLQDQRKKLQTYCNFIQNIMFKQLYYCRWKYYNKIEIDHDLAIINS